MRFGIIAALCVALVCPDFNAATLPRRRAVRMMRPALFRGDEGRSAHTSSRGLRQFDNLAWQRAIVSGAGSVLEHDGVLFVASSTRPGDRATVLAVDAATGSIVWSFLARGRIATPFAVDRGTLWLGSDDGVYGVALERGTEQAFVRTDSAVWSPPLISRNTIYFTTTGGEVRAIDAGTREPRWTVSLALPFPSEIAAWADVIVVTSRTTMVALSATDGREIWRRTISGDWMPHAVFEGVIYAGSADQQFFALNAMTGESIWTHRHAALEIGDWSSPAVSEGVVIAAARDGNLYAFDARTGDVRWRFATIDRAAFPVIAGGAVYFGITGHGSGTPTTPRSFYALDLTSGEELWHFTDDGLMLEGEPAVVNDAVYVASVSGKLYALR